MSGAGFFSVPSAGVSVATHVPTACGKLTAYAAASNNKNKKLQFKVYKENEL